LVNKSLGRFALLELRLLAAMARAAKELADQHLLILILPSKWVACLRLAGPPNASIQGTLFLVLCAASFALACDPQPVAERRPNVLLISFDSLRADHLSSYGYARRTSPNIDALAARGTLFENAFSSTTWTLPAHMALFTGLPDSLHAVNDNGSPPLDPNRTTLAEQFKAAGYSTAGFVSGPYLHPVFGFGRGFDEYVNCMSGTFTTTSHLRHPTTDALILTTRARSAGLISRAIRLYTPTWMSATSII